MCNNYHICMCQVWLCISLETVGLYLLCCWDGGVVYQDKCSQKWWKQIYKKKLHVKWEILIKPDFILNLILTFLFRNCSLESNFRINTQTTLMQNVACCEEQIHLGLFDLGIHTVCVDENSREEQMLWLSIHCISIFTLYWFHVNSNILRKWC